MLGFLSSVLPTIANVSPFNQAVKLGFDLLGQKLSNDIGGPAYKSQLPVGTVPINTRTTNITNSGAPGLAICPPGPRKPGRTGGLSFNSVGDSQQTASPSGFDNSSPPVINQFGEEPNSEPETEPEPEGPNYQRWRRAMHNAPPMRRPQFMRKPRQMKFSPYRDILANPNRSNWQTGDFHLACAECEN